MKRGNPLGWDTANLNFNGPKEWGHIIGKFANDPDNKEFTSKSDVLREFILNPGNAKLTALRETMKRALHDHELKKLIGVWVVSVSVLGGTFQGWCQTTLGVLTGSNGGRREETRRMARVRSVRKLVRRREEACLEVDLVEV